MRTTIPGDRRRCPSPLSAARVRWARQDEKPKAARWRRARAAYRNTFDFVWQSAQDGAPQLVADRERGPEEEDDHDRAGTSNLSPFSRHGRRDRLIVTIVGDGQGGWRANATQETETNKNEEDPLDEAKAKWETAAERRRSLAAKFLQNLDTRLQPDERWRDRLTR